MKKNIIYVLLLIILLNVGLVFNLHLVKADPITDNNITYEEEEKEKTDDFDLEQRIKFIGDDEPDVKNYDSGVLEKLISENGFTFFLIVFIIIPIVLAVYFILKLTVFRVSDKLSKVEKNKFKYKSYKKLSDDVIQEMIGKDFNILQFIKKIFYMFQETMYAYSSDKLLNVKVYLTNDIYNKYYNSLFMLKSGKKKNVIDDINYIDAKIINLNKEKDAFVFEMFLRITLKDYIVDTSDYSLAPGSNNYTNECVYKLSIIYDTNADYDYKISKIELIDKVIKKR